MRSLRSVSKGDEAAVDAALRTEEKREIEALGSPRPIVVHEVIRLEGQDELRRTNSMLIWSGLAAGLSMGFSLVSEGLIQAHLPNAVWRPLLVNFGYSIGFLIVVLGRQQLFTENTLTVILPLLTRRDRATFLGVARIWTIVLATNLIGAGIFAGILSRAGLFPPEVQLAFGEIARQSIGADFGAVFVRGVFAGWLIALMVWLLPAADAQKATIIVLVTYVVGLGGFSHIVAGSAEALYLVLTGGATFGQFLLGFAVPTLLGNVFGGVMLVAALNHAQATAGIERVGNGEGAASGKE
jgi:formate/nitrite transporter FocA (FNT family)